jgi:CheY-like chemotaxis protein
MPVIAEQPVSAVADDTMRRPAEPHYRGRILVVEDNEVNRKMMAMMWEWLRCSADFAANGTEAVAKATAEGQAYDLIMMDVVMPEMDGLDATRAIRAHEGAAQIPRAWIVALTASAMVGDRERCFEAGMNDFLSKPFRLGELIAVLARMPSCLPR